MNLLLDTHALLWALFEPDRLPASLRKILRDPAHGIHASAVSFWGISLKCVLGKLSLGDVSPHELPVAAENQGFSLLSLAAEEAASFHRLPRTGHKDPFDRMLAWQAIARGWPLASKDPELAAYRSEGLQLIWGSGGEAGEQEIMGG